MIDHGLKPQQSNRSPWLYVPTLYFAEGLPYILINSLSVIFYKNMGASNQFIGMTSLFMWPWVLKMLWAPLVDTRSTKRMCIIMCQAGLGIGLLLLALLLNFSFYITASLVLFAGLAFFSATHDIAIDGFYMLALSEKLQAMFVGIRSTFYRFAMIFGSGILVVFAGLLQRELGNTILAWQIVLGAAGLLFLVFFSFHRFYLPHPEDDESNATSVKSRSLVPVFRSYFQQKRIGIIVLFILFYRLGEAVLEKMSPAFLLDSIDAGGLGLATETVGLVKGTVGVISLTVGGIFGGWLISRYGLKKCIWPMALMLKVPDLVYVYMSIAKPSLAWVYLLVGFEQLGYGIGFTAFMVFLMYIAREPFKTSHYALSTGIMALGMMLPGMFSGFLQQYLGYTHFFIAVMLFTLPGLIILFFIPIPENREV